MEILERFYGNTKKGAISHFATFMWFCAIVLGIMMKREPCGIGTGTQIVWDLEDKYYTNIIDWFRSGAVDYDRLRLTWGDIVRDNFECYKLGGFILYTTDGVLNPKEGRRGSTVSRITKASGTQSKPTTFFGATTGTLDILTWDGKGKIFATPIDMRFTHGMGPMADWDNTPCPNAHLSTEQQEILMAKEDFERRNQDAILLADRATMSHISFDRMKEIREANDKDMWLVTCCKSRLDTYLEPTPEDYKGVGRYPLVGKKFGMEKADDKTKKFKTCEVVIYNRKEKIKYWSAVLMWGHTERRRLLFVICIRPNGERAVFATDKLDMDPIMVVKLYSLRFLCEEGFKQFKHTLHGFDYHFWCKRMPWNSFVRKSGDPHPLESVTDKEDQGMIIKEFRASSLALILGCIAQGLAQYISQQEEVGGIIQKYTIKRTYTPLKTSEHDVCRFLYENRDEIMDMYKDHKFIRFIKKRQRVDYSAEIRKII